MANKNETVKEIATRIATKVASEVALNETAKLLEQSTEKIEGKIAENVSERAKNIIAQSNDIIRQQYPVSGFIAILTKNGEISIPYGEDVRFTIKLLNDDNDTIEELNYNAKDFNVLNLREILTKIKKYDYCEFYGDNVKQVDFYDDDIFEKTKSLEESKYQKDYHKAFYGFCKTSEMVSIYKSVGFFDEK